MSAVYAIQQVREILQEAAPTTRIGEEEAFRIYFEKTPDEGDDFVVYFMDSIPEHESLSNSAGEYEFRVDIHMTNPNERFAVVDRLINHNKFTSLGGNPTEDEDIGTAFTLFLRYNL